MNSGGFFDKNLSYRALKASGFVPLMPTGQVTGFMEKDDEIGVFLSKKGMIPIYCVPLSSIKNKNFNR